LFSQTALAETVPSRAILGGSTDPGAVVLEQWIAVKAAADAAKMEKRAMTVSFAGR
jgi:hypothetical protein